MFFDYVLAFVFVVGIIFFIVFCHYVSRTDKGQSVAKKEFERIGRNRGLY